MKKKERNRRRPEAYKAMRLRIVALTLSLWLICMGLVTWAAAADMFRQLQYNAVESVSYSESRHSEYGWVENQMLHDLGGHYFRSSIEPLGFFMMKQRPVSISSDDWYWGKWELLYGYEPAMLIYGTTKEEEPREFRFGDGDYLFFSYMDKMNYTTLPQNSIGFGYIDLSSFASAPNDFTEYVNNWSKADGSLNSFSTINDLRMKGWFDGTQFHPITIDIKETRYVGLSESTYWRSLLSLPNKNGKELTEIYVTSSHRIGFPENPFTINGMSYDSLTDFLETNTTGPNAVRGNLFHAVIMELRRHNTTYGDYIIQVAYRCSPMGYAALRLIPFYLVSLVVLLIVLKPILRSLRKNLTAPLDNIIVAVACNAPLNPTAKWEEIYSLEQQYSKFQQSLSEKNTELQQLRTKLDYAQNAEENRRQLVSGLTHELKTPLAVIHSYAEGLKDGIAEEKEDHYLSVILEQSEKMDSMVLQMLDLSRLEAGKVRLSSDNFSLLALTKTVVDRFSPMLEEKGLTVNFGVAQEFLITADQARIEQVITNLVSNALKYTEPENRISISVFQHNGKAGFSIENPGKWLPEEALEKVWDSFFRVDPSRTAPGTGLGLAVVKQIIQLHQGSCKAHNTLYKNQDGTFPGVQFSFQIPMG